jgi:hypothetical protein
VFLARIIRKAASCLCCACGGIVAINIVFSGGQTQIDKQINKQIGRWVSRVYVVRKVVRNTERQKRGSEEIIFTLK